MSTGKSSRQDNQAAQQPASRGGQSGAAQRDFRGDAPYFGDPDTIIAAIENEIIPRLVRASVSIPRNDKLPGFAPPDVTRSDQDLFLGHILNSRKDEASRMALRFLARGAGVEAIFEDLLTWAARRLGALWEADECSFADVTIGLCHLQGILHLVSDALEQPSLASLQRTPTAFISPAPGEQHAFGALMVADCFRQDGWIVQCEAALSLEELIGTVSEHSFDIIGLSCARDQDKQQLAALIGAVRAGSTNKGALIMVGGRLFADHPGLGHEAGADLVAQDGFSAAKAARNRLARTVGDC